MNVTVSAWVLGLAMGAALGAVLTTRATRRDRRVPPWVQDAPVPLNDAPRTTHTRRPTVH